MSVYFVRFYPIAIRNMLQFFKFFEIALLQDFNDSEKNPLIPIHVLNNGSLKNGRRKLRDASI